MGETCGTSRGIKVVKNRQLSDEQLWNLSMCITNTRDLREIAVVGLQMKEHVVDSKISNHTNDIESAAHSVLKTWRNSQENRAEAYKKLHTALKKVKMPYLFDQVFGYSK